MVCQRCSANPGVCKSTSPLAILSDSARFNSINEPSEPSNCFQPRGFRYIVALLQRQLPRHKVERVDADAELEGVVALDDGGDLVAEEIRDCLDQFGGCRFVLHLYPPLGASSLSKSISVSDERRPIMARSIE